MEEIHYKKFAIESLKITLFCVITTLVFKLFGSSNETLLIVFNMAVMSSAATFSIEKRNLEYVSLGTAVIVISTVLGGTMGFYFPILSKILTVVYAVSAFYFSATQNQKGIFVSGALMFLILSAIPFSLRQGIHYLFDGVIVSIIFIIFNMMCGNVKWIPIDSEKTSDHLLISTITCVSLILGFFAGFLLKKYTNFSYLYWIPLTSLLIIQGSQGKTIQTSLKRIFSNTVGALTIVFLFNYVIPPIFWINFLMLLIFLFLIFSLGFSYFWRTLFIELFVLGFTHLLGSYHKIIAFDRIIMTCIGGSIVILSTLMIYFLHPNARKISK